MGWLVRKEGVGEVYKSFFGGGGGVAKARGTYRFVFALGFRLNRHVHGLE